MSAAFRRIGLSKAIEKECVVLGEKLSNLRRKQAMSQQEVADLLSVSRQTVSNWEGNQGASALVKAAELARICHVTLDNLVSERIEVVTASAAPAVAKGFLLLAIAVTFIYIACKLPKNADAEKEDDQMTSKKEFMLIQRLRLLKGKTCEFIMKSITTFDSDMTGRVMVTDFDDEWVLLTSPVERATASKRCA